MKGIKKVEEQKRCALNNGRGSSLQRLYPSFPFGFCTQILPLPLASGFGTRHLTVSYLRIELRLPLFFLLFFLADIMCLPL